MKYLIIFIMLFAGIADAQCLNKDMVSTSNGNISQSAIKVFDVDWNGDGVTDKVLLAKNGSCVQLIIISYNQKREIISHEFSGDVGTGEFGGYPTQIAINKKVLNLKTSQMRNHITLKFRYNTKSKQTVLIGKEVEYYGSGGYGPSRVSIDYISMMKIIYAYKFDEQKEKFISARPKKQGIKNGPVPLSDINVDNLYDDSENE
jgi:hypothetical protein